MGLQARIIALVCALLGAGLVALGCSMIGQLPAPGASGQDVYARFLDDRDSLRNGAAILIAGLGLLIVFVAAVRIRFDPLRERLDSAVFVLAGTLAIAAGMFAAAAIGALAIGAESADPASSRAVLDLSQVATSVAGLLAAIALAAAAYLTGFTERRSGEGRPVRRPLVAIPALAAAAGCLLWLVPLVSDAEAFAPGSSLGFVVGLVLLLVWVVVAALALAVEHPGRGAQ